MKELTDTWWRWEYEKGHMVRLCNYCHYEVAKILNILTCLGPCKRVSNAQNP